MVPIPDMPSVVMLASDSAVGRCGGRVLGISSETGQEVAPAVKSFNVSGVHLRAAPLALVRLGPRARVRWVPCPVCDLAIRAGTSVTIRGGAWPSDRRELRGRRRSSIIETIGGAPPGNRRTVHRGLLDHPLPDRGQTLGPVVARRPGSFREPLDGADDRVDGWGGARAVVPPPPPAGTAVQVAVLFAEGGRGAGR